MDPMVPIAVVCVDDECRDPALKLTARQLADYRKSYAPEIIKADGVIQPGRMPRWFTLQHINGSFIVGVLGRFDGDARAMQAFVASCHEIKLPNGAIMKPLASQIVDSAFDTAVADFAWWNQCVNKLGAKVCLAIGRVAADLAALPEDERGVFLSADGPAPTP